MPSPAQAGSPGKFFAAGIIGAVIGSALTPIRLRPTSRLTAIARFTAGYEGSYASFNFRNSPIFDEYGNRIGARPVRA